jgi:hypothetical protein
MDPQPMGRFPGICVLAAVVGGLAGGLAPAQGLALLPQRITFDQPPDAVVGQSVRLSAATDARKSLVVSFRSDTPDACVVSGATVVTTTAGVCTITASQGGNQRYAAAQPARRSFQAHTGVRQQTISFVPPPNTALGQSPTLSASTDAKSLTVSYRSESPAVCTVSDATVTTAAMVTTIAPGTCDITAFQGGSAVYAAAQASGSFKVIAHGVRFGQQIVFDQVPGTTVGVPVVLTASSRILATSKPRSLVTKDPDPPTGLPVSYTSQDRRVCTVSGATVVPGPGAGA